MNLNEKHLIEVYEDCYRKGIEYRNCGNNAGAKMQFGNAAAALFQLAERGDISLKDERRKNAVRLERIANAIQVEDNGVTKQVRSVQKSPEQAPESLLFYPVEQLPFGFEGVVGLEYAKEQIKRYVINPKLYPNAYSYNYSSNTGILLIGPPGTGKTTFAKAVAYEIKQPFALINCSALINCYIGETGKNIDKLFAYLRRYSENNHCGITVFFDEFDEIAKKRCSEDKSSEAAVPALLRNLDGMMTNGEFLILANTNLQKDFFDPGVWDRFRQRINISLPNQEERRLLFACKLKEIEEDYLQQINFVEAAELSEGMSGRDIDFICDDFKYMLSEAKAGINRMSCVTETLKTLIVSRKLN